MSYFNTLKGIIEQKLMAVRTKTIWCSIEFQPGLHLGLGDISVNYRDMNQRTEYREF